MPARGEARERLLDAALSVIRQQGYSATTVDDLCRAAEVTKGAFFHHFDSKEALGIAAVQHWSATTGALFAAADYRREDDPLARLLAYLDLRKALLSGELADFTCLAGTMVQESFASSPSITAACRDSIVGHAATLEPTIAEAMAAHGIAGPWTAASLAIHTQAVLQGAFVLAKTQGEAARGAALAAESIDHLRRYILLLFNPENEEGIER